MSIDGETHVLEKPFLVIATQNPVESQGTFPLPEAQLDRFLFKIQMGYPSHEEGLQILRRFKGANPLEQLAPAASTAELLQAQQAYAEVVVHDAVLDYLLTVVERTRTHEDVVIGVSPRGSQALLRAVQVHAVLRGRDYVTPDDVKALAKPVLAHRLVLSSALRYAGQDSAKQLIDSILREVPYRQKRSWPESRGVACDEYSVDHHHRRRNVNGARNVL